MSVKQAITDLQAVARQLDQARVDLLRRGPDRVMVDPDEALPPWRARDEYDTTADIIFIRNDLWMLGAPTHLEHDAYRLWADEWIGFIRPADGTLQPISEYQPRRKG